MEIQRSKKAEHTEIRLHGRLDASWCGQLEAELDDVIRAGETRVRLQMSQVAFMSSAGIRVLLKYLKMLKGLGGTFRVVDPSKAVSTVLELSGLAGLLLGSEPPPATLAAQATEPSEIAIGPLRCSVHNVAAGGSLRCRLAGDPSRLGNAQYAPADARAVDLGPNHLAVGIGAFGQDAEDCAGRFGEMMAAGGAVICLPTDGANVPDYLLCTGTFVPRVHTLYAAVCEGRLSRCIRFQTEGEEAAAGLSAIVRAALRIAAAPVAGIVMLAESAGLIGAALKASPAAAGTTPRSFAHPEIRNWLTFTPEPSFDRSLALVAGMATTGEKEELAGFVRPLDRDGSCAGHFHAAAFAFKALPKGAMALEETVAGLFEESRLLGLLHLVSDHRDIVGAGESRFVRGAVWVSPIGSITMEGR
ncbi:MAG: STAS domain-containing protein [Acidobacteriota bacterium]